MQPTLGEIAAQFDTDKTTSQGYISNYEQVLGSRRSDRLVLLELGVLRGGSLLTWQEYFTAGLIVGLDVNAVELPPGSERIRFYRGSQDDVQLLNTIASETAPDGFDIIIDDAAHVGALARTSFQSLFRNHLKPGGIYVVEDWGTGYWPGWPDGAAYGRAAESVTVRTRLQAMAARAFGLDNDHLFASHNFGMVGFVKELVDECGMADITHPERGSPPSRESMIDHMRVCHGQVFVTKRL